MTTKVASIYFEERTASRPLYNGKFRLPAAQPGGPPVVIEIQDHIQMERMPYEMGGHQIPRRILGEEIARDVVREWSTNALGMSGACGPGIWVVRERIPLMNPDGTLLLDVEKNVQYRDATEDEKAQMWAEDLAEQAVRNEAWGDYLINQGDTYDADLEKRQYILISPSMRAAAKHFGREVGWLNRKVRTEDRKNCIFCTKSIPAAAIKCPSCSEIVDRDRYREATGKVSPPLVPNEAKKQQPAA